MKILFWVPGGMKEILSVEGIIAKSLNFRGIETHAIICDGKYCACVRREIFNGYSYNVWSDLCERCCENNTEVLKKLGIEYSYVGDYISLEEFDIARKLSQQAKWDEIDSIEYHGINIGTNIKSSIYRYLQGHRLEKCSDNVMQEYVFSAYINAIASKKALDILKPEKLYMSHAIYVDWGPAVRMANKKGIPVIGWMSSYLASNFYFKVIRNVDVIDMHNIDGDNWSNIVEDNLSDENRNRLNEYIKRRYLDNISFDMGKFSKYSELSIIKAKYSFDNINPTWAIFTHVNWDSVTDYAPMLYKTFNEWIIDTITIIKKIKNVNFIIKIHPAEKWSNKNGSGIEDLIRIKFTDLPNNVKLIGADEKINPLNFYQMIDGGITVYGTAGLELSLFGKPVILAGTAHYGNKGFTYDANTIDEYKNLLMNTDKIAVLSETQIEYAKKYAYNYFIQRQIPLLIVKDDKTGWWKIHEDRLDNLLPGKDLIIDFLCNKIISDEEFIMDDEFLKKLEKEKYYEKYK
ncbi:capsular polysaccharide export protein, LipB/KpsS family [Anaerosinus gibii]|uniref:Capsule polysaccharide biosynthesis protein n=1 Tax=Selenobaculum gibii TaxID=3054208 RepID=A0A9Y2ES19_9FIRM|nr:hypothetical protein [Selenobaculum gbiensis]WIW70383.1 hypothetical protein P3F81_10870 [Selenobaculum gbiensis]